METRRIRDLSVLAAWREDEDPQKLPASRTFRHGTVLRMLPPSGGFCRFTVEGEDDTVWVTGTSEIAKETEPAARTMGGQQ